MPLAPVFLALALAAPRPPTPAPDASPDRAAPAASPDVRDEVRAYLGAIHEPVPAETYRALGPGAEDALADFARTDPSPIVRLRALEALAALGGSRAEAVHREVAESAAPRAVRRGAIRGLARLAGEADAPRVLGPFLERDRDPAVRAAAAEALAREAPAQGCARIRARARVDPERARFSRAIADCDRRGRARPPAR